MQKISLNNGRTLVDLDEVSTSEINQNWDVLVNAMDDEARERAHREYMDAAEAAAAMFDPETPFSTYEGDNRMFLRLYLKHAPCDLII